MRIAHVIHGFPPFNHAGSENYAYALAIDQAHRHGVVVFHRIADALSPEYEVTEGRVAELPVVRINRTFRDFKSFVDTYRSDKVASVFGGFLDRFRPHVVHFHHVTCLSTTCVHEASTRHIPIFYTLHDFWLLCPRGQLLRRDLSLCETHNAADCVRCMAHQLPIRGGHVLATVLEKRASTLQKLPLPAKLYGWLASRPFRNEPAALEEIHARNEHISEMCRLVDRFNVPSILLRDRYVEFGAAADKIAVFDYGFDHSTWKDRRARSRTNGLLRSAYIGTWIPSKGVHVLVEAARTLDPTRISLDVYGYAPPYDGFDDYGRYLRQLAGNADHIRFRGTYQPDSLPEILAEVDVLVIPSIWYENSPLTIHEAFLAGVPVVVSDHGGMRELVQDGINGLTFRPGDPKSLRSQLMRVIDEPNLLNHFRTNIPTVKPIEDNAAEIEATYYELQTKHLSAE